LLPGGEAYPAHFGISVGLSGDGNTAVVGGSGDNFGVGATWIFTRSNGVWTQQGAKLVGTGVVPGIEGGASQGNSVALSGDGNTAIVGGPFDNSLVGATWIFTRSNGVWTQQGAKLVGIGTVDSAAQGMSVALSIDGNTAIVGGPYDNGTTGAAWIFIRDGSIWTQQGAKLIPAGAEKNTFFGYVYSVSISGDGNRAIVGGYGDNAAAGAAWVYKRSAGTWTQLEGKLFGTGAVGNARQGSSVALSADGATAISGGPQDSGGVGAAWIFALASAAQVVPTLSGMVLLAMCAALAATGWAVLRNR